MSRADQRSYTEAEKLRALANAREHGVADAARRLGIPAGSIRRWRHERNESGPPSGQDPDGWAAAKEAGAREAWTTAQQALKRVKALLKDGKTNEAKSAALVFAILCDKSAVLEVGAAAARTRVVAGELVGSPVIHIPNDDARLAEIGRLMREIGVLGGDDDQDRGEGDDRRPPDRESMRQAGQFAPMPGPPRVQRVNQEPQVEVVEVVADAAIVPEVDGGVAG